MSNSSDQDNKDAPDSMIPIETDSSSSGEDENTHLEVTFTALSMEDAVDKLRVEIMKREEAQKALQETLLKVENQKSEVERLNKLMIGRELAMAELKQKVKNLEEKLPH